MKENSKRLFFALEVQAPWPQELPKGRILDENHRHLTLAFLGWTNFAPLKNCLSSFPVPSFKVGFAGKFDKCLLLPKRGPRVVAWHVAWMEGVAAIEAYQQAVISWLKFQGFAPDERHDFLPHVTLCRAPFEREAWENSFVQLPMIAHNIHLYESVGNLVYKPLWTLTVLPPFQEIEHTADLAFKVYGENIDRLHRHAFAALAFKFPRILEFVEYLKSPMTLNELIANLNQTIAYADAAIGSPLKAVSYHGELEETEEGTLTWEMIVDV